jgi:hypothetical protein
MLLSERIALSLITRAVILVALVCSLRVSSARAQEAPGASAMQGNSHSPASSEIDRRIHDNAEKMLRQGRQIFRYDTFGSEHYWGDALQLHKALAGEKNGGIGAGVSPKTALSAGLKVDVDSLPDSLKQQLKAGKLDLDDPANTVALLKLNAVVGVTGLFDQDGKLRSMGLQCAFCHSTVDDSFAPGIGMAIITDLTPHVRT